MVKNLPAMQECAVLCLVAQSCVTLQPHELYEACQSPLCIGFSRQEYWSVLPFLSLGDLPDSGIEPESPALQADFYRLNYQGSPMQETQVQSLGPEGPLEKGMATYSSSFAWEIP